MWLIIMEMMDIYEAPPGCNGEQCPQARSPQNYVKDSYGNFLLLWQNKSNARRNIQEAFTSKDENYVNTNQF